MLHARRPVLHVHAHWPCSRERDEGDVLGVGEIELHTRGRAQVRGQGGLSVHTQLVGDVFGRHAEVVGEQHAQCPVRGDVAAPVCRAGTAVCPLPLVVREQRLVRLGAPVLVERDTPHVHGVLRQWWTRRVAPPLAPRRSRTAHRRGTLRARSVPRSILPFCSSGSASSSTTRRGIMWLGSCAANHCISRSLACGSSWLTPYATRFGTAYATSSASSCSACSTAAAPSMAGCVRSACSTSPSSTRWPRSLTCSSVRARNSIDPSARRRT